MRMRSRIYEEVGNIRRAAELQAPFSPTLELWLAAGATVARRDLERVFATELDTLPYDARKRTPCHGRRTHAGVRPGTSCDTPLDVPAARKTAVDAIISVLEREE